MSYDTISTIYIGNGRLIPGKQLTIDDSTNSGCADTVAELVKLPEETIKERLEASIEAEKLAVKKLSDAVADEWAPHARATTELREALEYLRTRPVKHTSNQWINEGGFYDYRISNMVYVMHIQAWEKTEFDHSTKKSNVTGWYVTWSVYLNYYESYRKTIAEQQKKLYRDMAAAVKYLEGRCKEYSHLFTAISPPVPEEYAEYFKVNGVLLPGYIIAGEQTHAKVLLELEEELAPSPASTKVQDTKHRHMGQSHIR